MDSGVLTVEGLEFDCFLSQLDSSEPSSSLSIPGHSSMGGPLIKPCRASAAWSHGGSLHQSQEFDSIGIPEDSLWRYPPDLLPPTPPFASHGDDFMDLPALEEELAGFVELIGTNPGLSEEDKFLVDNFLNVVPDTSPVFHSSAKEEEHIIHGRGGKEERKEESSFNVGKDQLFSESNFSRLVKTFPETSSNASDWIKKTGLVRESSECSCKSDNSFTSVTASFSPSGSFSGRSGSDSVRFLGGGEGQFLSKIESKLYEGQLRADSLPSNRFLTESGYQGEENFDYGAETFLYQNGHQNVSEGTAGVWRDNWELAKLQSYSPSQPLDQLEEFPRFPWEMRDSSEGHPESCSCGDCQVSNLDWKVREITRQGTTWSSPYKTSTEESSMESVLRRSLDGFKPSVDKDFNKDFKPVVVSTNRPSRPADISDRLAAIVGTLTKDGVSKAVSGSGLSVTPGSINAVTVRPPSEKQRAPRTVSKPATSSKVNNMPKTPQHGNALEDKSFSHVSQLKGPLGVRKPGRSGRPRKILAVEEAAVKRAACSPDPLSDLVLSKRISALSQVGRTQVPNATLKQQLIALAEAVATDDQARARFLTGILKEEARPTGDVMQRVAFHFMTALATKAGGTGAVRYNAPLSTEKNGLQVALQTCGMRLPYLQFFFEASNAAMWEVVAGQSKVHLVDLGIWQCSNWKILMRQLAAQPGGPPHLRITGVDAPWVGNPLKGIMRSSPAVMGRELSQLATELDIPFEFHVVESRLENLRPFMIRQEPGEVMAVTSTLRFQYLWDQTVVRSSPRDMVLQFVRQLSPRIFTFVDMDVDFNGPFFLERFRESLDFFHVLFEAQESAFPSSHCPYRQKFETEYFGRDIINVIACEGLQRVVRSERLEKWQLRLTRAGFGSVGFSARVIPTLEKSLERYPEGFGVRANMGGLQLTWKGRSVMATSAWRPLY